MGTSIDGHKLFWLPAFVFVLTLTLTLTLARYGGLPVFKGECGYFELDTSVDGEPMDSL